MGNVKIVYTEEGEGFGRCRSGEVGSHGGGDYGGGRYRVVENGSRNRIFKGRKENGVGNRCWREHGGVKQ